MIKSVNAGTGSYLHRGVCVCVCVCVCVFTLRSEFYQILDCAPLPHPHLYGTVPRRTKPSFNINIKVKTTKSRSSDLGSVPSPLNDSVSVAEGVSVCVCVCVSGVK